MTGIIAVYSPESSSNQITGDHIFGSYQPFSRGLLITNYDKRIKKRQKDYRVGKKLERMDGKNNIQISRFNMKSK
ncbi:UNKNOWN [Stylonychia lemnae]|uniref:Uncharacterized protein n=1 Tax=Stylonychia lemnae TaxID=5949 RepID=A0A078AY19_STYLE|nr:UNKNOWN [Stylonychia lemnae]|eukprot:CDW86112.1 UNKNOWN [Stylonychia lemnae]